MDNFLKEVVFKTNADIQRMLSCYSNLTKNVDSYIKNVPYNIWRELQKSTKMNILVYPDRVDIIYNFNWDVKTFTIPKFTTGSASGFYEYIVSSISSGDFDAEMAYDNGSKENDKKMKGFNFDFGPCTNDNIRMSMYGLAVKNNADSWVSYNPKSGEIVDVDILNFDGRKFMFKMPVAIKDIAVGDIVIHNRVPMFVTEITENGNIKAVDVRAGERKEIIPTRNMFNFNFITKVVSLFNAVGDAPTPDMPFGNMLPFLMLGDENSKDMDMDTMLMFMMMQNQGNANLMQNPMMMYFMMKDGDMKSDMLPLMMMMGMNQPQKSVE